MACLQAKQHCRLLNMKTVCKNRHPVVPTGPGLCRWPGLGKGALGTLAKRLSTRSVRLARMILIQAIRNAMLNDLAVRNVADLAAVPTGKPGRPSRSLDLEQALAVLDAAKGERLWPYVAVSMLGGIRTEEARALRWSEVDLEVGTVAVYRSVRRTDETKTERSQRVFQVSEIAVEALRELILTQAAARAKAGAVWKETTWCSAPASAARCTRPMSGFGWLRI